MTRRIQEADLASLFHLNSSNARARLPDLTVDEDGRPPRFRTYPGAERVALPGRDLDLPVALGAALAARRSHRAFDRRPLALELVGRILYAAYGVRGYKRVEDDWSYDRNAPSAGGLYPLELYVSAQQVADLPDGIYHYDVRAHELELRREGAHQEQLADMAIGQEMLADANVILVLAAVVERTTWKYGQRGYRYVWLDAGHAGQNVYLAATALGLGAAAVGGFFDREVNELLLLPGDEQAIYLVAVGHPG
jgi:SagB-type dehydrogenase family enzyme